LVRGEPSSQAPLYPLSYGRKVLFLHC